MKLPLAVILIAMALGNTSTTVSYVAPETPYTAVRAYVTGYHTVEEQTDETPCISASGDNICGRTDVVACPREIPLGTKVEIDGKIYSCLDRTAPQYDGVYDISCDKNEECPAMVTGWKTIKIF